MPDLRHASLHGRHHSWRLAWALFALIGVPGCEGSKHLIFEAARTNQGTIGPFMPPVDTGTKPPDAGRKPPPPVPDARIPDPEDDAGHEPDPGATNVDFTWKESLPGQGTCRAGRYSGSFDCTLDGLDDLPLTFSAGVAFTLVGSPEMQELTITDGELSGYWVHSELTGKLDCVRKFFDTTSVDGQVIVIDVQNPFFIDTPTFNAKIQGWFDDQFLVIEGTIAMENVRGQTCSGAFRVSAVP